MKRIDLSPWCLLLLGWAIPWAQAGVDAPPAASPLADPAAQTGGTISLYGGPYPKSLNYYLEFSTGASDVFSTLFDPLVGQNNLTLELEPAIARSWTVSEDQRTFTFELDERARWSDGLPITADDVKWTYDALMASNSLTGPWQVIMGKLQSPEILGPRSIRFRAREVHWSNLLNLNNLYVLPRHIYEGRDFNDQHFDFPVVSGLYRVKEIKEGFYLDLERRDDWWRKDDPSMRGLGNFAVIRYNYYQEMESAYEVFGKGAIDYIPVYSARRWVKETAGPRYDRNWIVRQKVYNYNPIGMSAFAMNMRKPPFDDRRVRLALAHLLDREKLVATLMYNQYTLLRSVYEDLYGPAHPCTNELIRFDPARARELLAEAGWKPNPQTGVLERDGRPFTFKFLSRDLRSESMLVVYKEDLKKAGIEMSIERKDWSAWMKAMDEYNYEMTWTSYSGSLLKDPETMWKSKEADRPAGSNVTGFKDPEVDALIEKQKTIFDVETRHAICREIDARVCREVPAILLWSLDYTRLTYWNKFGMPDHVLGKFGDERVATAYWWYDPDADEILKDGMSTGRAIPPRPPIVRFDQVFHMPVGGTHTQGLN